MAAERLFFPDRSPSVMVAANDLRAEKYLASLFANQAAFLDCARADAEQILTVSRHQVEAVAEALLEHKTLCGAEIDDILSESLTPALRAERARRRRWTAAMAASAGAFGKGLALRI
jgi:hypothetical protein